MKQCGVQINRGPCSRAFPCPSLPVSRPNLTVIKRELWFQRPCIQRHPETKDDAFHSFRHIGPQRPPLGQHCLLPNKSLQTQSGAVYDVCFILPGPRRPPLGQHCLLPDKSLQTQSGAVYDVCFILPGPQRPPLGQHCLLPNKSLQTQSGAVYDVCFILPGPRRPPPALRPCHRTPTAPTNTAVIFPSNLFIATTIQIISGKRLSRRWPSAPQPCSDRLRSILLWRGRACCCCCKSGCLGKQQCCQ